MILLKLLPSFTLVSPTINTFHAWFRIFLNICRFSLAPNKCEMTKGGASVTNAVLMHDEFSESDLITRRVKLHTRSSMPKHDCGLSTRRFRDKRTRKRAIINTTDNSS